MQSQIYVFRDPILTFREFCLYRSRISSGPGKYAENCVTKLYFQLVKSVKIRSISKLKLLELANFMHCNKQKKKRVHKPRRVGQACEGCQKKKIRCDGSWPCLSCLSAHVKCTYKNREDAPPHNFFSNDHCLSSSLHHAKLSLEMMENSNTLPHLRKSVSSLVSALEELQPQLYMKMDSTEITNYRGTKSLEAVISVSHCLNRFTCGLADTFEPVSAYFGLYSPILFLTPLGIAWLIKNFISYSDDKDRRETIFLLLKHFDAGTVIYQNSVAGRNVSPLRFYAIKNKIDADERTVVEHIIRDIANKEMTASRHLSLDNPSVSFRHSVLMIEELYSTFNHANGDTSVLRDFTKKHELIFSLCLEFFQRSIFANPHNITIVKSSLELIRHSCWIEDSSIFGTIISNLCRMSLNLGLNRWEYYTCKQESDADEDRKIWWSCYWWDRWYAIISGKPPLIPDDMNCCLFPREVMNLGVDETMDCMSLVESVELNESQPIACISFGYILLGKIISNVFSAILYNRNFTDYRLSTKSNFIHSNGLVNKLKVDFGKIVDLFAKLQEKFTPFLKRSQTEFVFCELHIHLQFVTVCCFQAIESLILRVAREEQCSELKVYAAQSREQVFLGSLGILMSMFELKSEIYSVMFSWTVGVAMLNVTAHLISEPSRNNLYHLSLICGVTSFFSNVVKGNRLDDSIRENSSCEKLKHGVAGLFILIRIICQTYIDLHNVSRLQLMEDLNTYGSACHEIATKVLDIESSWYKLLLRNRMQSGFTQTVLGHINKNLNDFTENEIEGSSEIAISHIENTPLDTHVTTLEEFIDAEVSLDFLNSIWSDIPLDIYNDLTISAKKDVS